MKLLREFAHDSYAEYRRKRSIRIANRPPRKERMLVVWAWAWIVSVGATIVGSVLLIISLNWFALLICFPLAVAILIVWYRFMIWYEGKHINGDTLHNEDEDND